MRKVFFLPVLLLLFQTGLSQDSLNMSLIFRWDPDSILKTQNWGGMWQQYNEIWGYYDSIKKREYGIIGTGTGTYIFDVTDTNNIYIADFEPGLDTADIHRDFKTYKNYLYGVADEGFGSLQIFDMSYLPDSVHKVYDDNEFVVNSHNAFVENNRLYLCGVRDSVGSSFVAIALRVLDISNPESPTLLKDIPMTGQGNYTHDIYVRNDTAYCSNLDYGLFVYDLTDIMNPVTIASITSYNEQGYNHSSWMTDDGKHLFFVDENIGLGIKSANITDLNNIEIDTIFRSHVGAMPHNIFVKGDKLYVSYYHDGVWVFGISDPTKPEVLAYYDTYIEQSGYYSYQGCWGVYPYLPSGIILASDFSNGFFVLHEKTFDDTTGNDTTGTTDRFETRSTDDNQLKAYPTVVNQGCFIQIPTGITHGVLDICNINGQKIESIIVSSSLQFVNMSAYSTGNYILDFKTPQMHYSTMVHKR